MQTEVLFLSDLCKLLGRAALVMI